MFENSAETVKFFQLADGSDLDDDIPASFFFLFLVLGGKSVSFSPFPS